MDRKQIPLLSLADSCRVFGEATGGTMEAEKELIIYRNPSVFHGRTIIWESCDLEKTVNDLLKNNPTPMLSFTEGYVDDDHDEIMKKAGYMPLVAQHGMIFDMDKAFDESICPFIELVNDESIAEWKDTVEKGFGPQVPREDIVFDTFNSCDKDKVKMYSYVKDGRIVSAAILILEPGLSGIHNVATLPEETRKGYASMIITRILQDVKKAGMDQVSLQASDTGRLVYEKLGFEKVSMIRTYIHVR